MTLVNHNLAFACQRVISRFGTKGTLGGAAFNKVMTLLNRRLLGERSDQRVDLNLPHCWYLFGDEVVPRELPPQVRFEPKDDLIARTTFSWYDGTDEPLLVPEWLTRRIMTELDRIEEEFGNPIDLEEVVDEVYSEAPFKFQESFLDLRRSLRTATKRTEIIVRNAGEGLVKPRFERAIILFPESDFPRLKSITRQYQRLMRYSLAGGDPGVGYADRFTTEYWQVFCYFLRIHERGHFNVSQARLDYWGRVASEYLSASGPKMNAIAEEMIGTLDSSIDPLDRACLIGADWGKGSERTSIEVHSLVY